MIGFPRAAGDGAVTAFVSSGDSGLALAACKPAAEPHTVRCGVSVRKDTFSDSDGKCIRIGYTAVKIKTMSYTITDSTVCNKAPR